MNFLHSHLDLALRAAAIVQIAVAILNLFLVRIMKWEPDLQRMPLLIREVFHIHGYFISLTLMIFGVLTWRFADEMAAGTNPIDAWLAGGIGIFWVVRSVMQWSHYSPSHWRGDTGRTAIHFLLFFGYGALAIAYFMAASWRNV